MAEVPNPFGTESVDLEPAADQIESDPPLRQVIRNPCRQGARVRFAFDRGRDIGGEPCLAEMVDEERRVSSGLGDRGVEG